MKAIADLVNPHYIATYIESIILTTRWRKYSYIGAHAAIPEYQSL